MKQTLSNDLLTITIDTLGAELRNITANRTRHEYLWQGDPAFWGRRSPVLFPIVGAVSRGSYSMDGNTYAMSQHGFARDREFSIIDSANENEAWFSLEADDTTLPIYPRRFRLEIGYALHETRISVMWRVTNLDTRTMHFQIGAHPAFNYPAFNPADSLHGFFDTDARDTLVSQVIAQNGCVGSEDIEIDIDADRLLPITESTFSRDAIILANRQVHRVSLLDTQKSPYITLLFDSPLVGLWSPSPKAPFVCIEPWWGRCDRLGFDGDFSDREYINTLEPGQTFTASYTILVDNI